MTAILRKPVSIVRNQTITLDNIMQIIAGQAMGFHFGKPKRVGEKSLCVTLPILRDGEIVRDYITYPEVKESVLVTDSGAISQVNLKNETDLKVYVRSGTVFTGKGTQSRVITRSAILFPGKAYAADARCVHASHGIQPGAKFDYHGNISIDVEKAVYGAGFAPRDQSTYWNNVATSNTMKSSSFTTMDVSSGQPVSADGSTVFTADSSIGGIAENRLADIELADSSIIRGRGFEPSHTQSRRAVGARAAMGSMGGPRASAMPQRKSSPYGRPQGGAMPGTSGPRPSPRPAPDSFVANDQVFTQNLDSILSQVKLHDHQVGISLITDRGVETVELFEMDQSWSALHKDAVARMGTELIKEEKPDVFEVKPEYAIDQVCRVLALNYDANTIYEHGSAGSDRVRITGLTSASHIGEVVELGGKVIHLSLLKRAA